ncbi:MAG: hypothetical protein FWD94_03725 [Treponema sp.]|nr:hypothetical protein [Treponema sp.]
MPHFANRRFLARLIFVLGLFLVFLGSTFLIGSTPGISRGHLQAAFLLIAVGVGCAVLALGINRRPLYLFFAALLLQSGLFFLLMAFDLMPFGFSRAWPLLSVFSGIALLPAGWHRYGALKSRYVVLAAGFILLGCFLMIFSLDIVGFSFRRFVLDWWPLLVALAGLVLVLASLGSRFLESSKK